MKTMAIVGDDAGGFLAAMLKGVKAEGSDGGGFGMPEDAEHATLFAECVSVQILVQIVIQVVVGFGGRSGVIAGRGFHMVHRALV